MTWRSSASLDRHVVGRGLLPSPTSPLPGSLGMGGTRTISARILLGLEGRFATKRQCDLGCVVGTALVGDVLVEPQLVSVTEVEEQAADGGHNADAEGDDESTDSSIWAVP